MLSFPQLGGDRGYLVVEEGMENMPFEIKRMLYLWDKSRCNKRVTY